MTAVRNVPGVFVVIRRLKISATREGRPISRWSRMTPSKKARPAAGRSASVKGEGSRRHQRQKKLCTAPEPSRSQIRCSCLGSSQSRKPLSNAVNPIPALAHCRLAHSCPLSQIQIGYGAYALVFQNAPPHSGSHR